MLTAMRMNKLLDDSCRDSAAYFVYVYAFFKLVVIIFTCSYKVPFGRKTTSRVSAYRGAHNDIDECHTCRASHINCLVGSLLALMHLDFQAKRRRTIYLCKFFLSFQFKAINLIAIKWSESSEEKLHVREPKPCSY